MNKITKILCGLLIVISFNSSAQEDSAFKNIYKLIGHKNFFKAREEYDQQKDNLSKTQKYVIEAILDNAFNKTESSTGKIWWLLKQDQSLADTLALKLCKIKADNSVKSFDYNEARNSIASIFDNYKHLLSKDETKELENELKIWTALKNEPKQQVTIKELTRLKMHKDKAGLNNLKVWSGKDSIDFIFDTGANLSTVTQTTARKMDMRIIPVDIQVGALTGEEVKAQLAVCPMLKLGSIEIRNGLFLVLKDDALAFAQINYQIHGIIGFPIIEALNEIQITQNGYFVIPRQQTAFDGNSNMAMDGLTPLFYLDNRHYSLDTGASDTILYAPYFFENEKQITSSYPETQISFGGAGGVKTFTGYKIPFDFTMNGKTVTLKDVSVITKIADDKENGVYGNIGQDVIKSFDKLTLNFRRMFLKFD